MDVSICEKLSYNLSLKLKVIKTLGYNINSKTVILDFGCGSGRSVAELLSNGLLAYGCDLKFKTDEKVNTSKLKNNNVIRLINYDPYVLPFEDNSIDVLFSDQVFEHVHNYPEVISELRRIIKPGGISLHIFPSRYKLIEAHVYVPMSSIIKTEAWLLMWAKMGIRNEFQKELSSQDTAKNNYVYLTNHTNYLTKSNIIREFKKYFSDVEFCEEIFLKHSGRGRYLYFINKIFPFLFIPSIYSTLKSRVIFTK